MDLDGDARLCVAEFYDGIQPTYSFTKQSLAKFKMRIQTSSNKDIAEKENRVGKSSEKQSRKSVSQSNKKGKRLMSA